MSLTGAVLVGGKSRRMGRDKAFLDIHGKTFVERIAESLLEICPRVLLVGGDEKSFSSLTFEWCGDIVEDSGPLGGIHAALTRSKTDVLIVACDLPLVNKDVLQSLIARRSPNIDVTIVAADDMIQPLLGIYSTRCLPQLSDYLEEGGRKVSSFLELCTMETLRVEGAREGNIDHILANVNTPEEYRAILQKIL